MAMNKIVDSLAKLSLRHLHAQEMVLCSVREFHKTSETMKNFNSRLPRDLKMGRFRFEKGVDLSKPTLTPLVVAKTGGRGPDGRIWIHRIGGGDKVRYRMVDFAREGPTEGEPLVERVNAVIKDDFRSAALAVVAGGNRKRYILATENMKAGDLIKTSGKLTAMPVRASEGDAHPVGSLPLGTIVHNIALRPGEPGLIAHAAGTSGVYVRKIGDKCVIRMPSKRELIVSQETMISVGRVSNVDHHKTKKMTKAGENRWRGKRPKSGWWQRKTGYHGRKIRPMKPPVVLDKPPPEKPELFKYTV